MPYIVSSTLSPKPEVPLIDAMINEFFSELRGVASLIDGVEARLRDRESLDVDGPQHHALQQAALRNFKHDVIETKARMKTLQPTVVVSQSRLLSWQQ